jgi:hypothetical protein
VILFPGVAWESFTYQFPAAGQWYHVVVGRDNGTWRAWVDGVQDGFSYGVTPGAASNAWRLGARTDGTMPFNGAFGSARFHAVAPEATLIGGLYQQWRRGYPDLLNRSTRRVYGFKSPAAPAAGATVYKLKADPVGGTVWELYK